MFILDIPNKISDICLIEALLTYNIYLNVLLYYFYNDENDGINKYICLRARQYDLINNSNYYRIDANSIPTCNAASNFNALLVPMAIQKNAAPFFIVILLSINFGPCEIDILNYSRLQLHYKKCKCLFLICCWHFGRAVNYICLYKCMYIIQIYIMYIYMSLHICLCDYSSILKIPPLTETIVFNFSFNFHLKPF